MLVNVINVSVVNRVIVGAIQLVMNAVMTVNQALELVRVIRVMSVIVPAMTITLPHRK